MFNPKRILVPTDFSKCADNALAQAAEIAEQFNSEITLIHVGSKDTDHMPLFFLDEEKLKDIHKKFDDYISEEIDKLCAKYLLERDIKFKKVIKHGQPYRDILEYAASEHIDLIVISSKGRSALEGFFFGSTTEKVVRKAPCSVLVTRYQGKND